MIDTSLKIIDTIIKLFSTIKTSQSFDFENHIESIYQELTEVHLHYQNSFRALQNMLIEREYVINKDVTNILENYKVTFEERRIKLKVFAEVFTNDENKNNINPLIFDFYDSISLYFHFSTGETTVGKTAFSWFSNALSNEIPFLKIPGNWLKELSIYN
jgi:hypothetical protein